MAKKFVLMQKHPGEMTADELRATLGDLADSVIMRSLIIAEVEAIRAGAERENRTMRNLWYNLIKPALSRAGLLHKTTRGGKPVAWDAKLSVYICELVREGYTTYEELRIIDGSRQRQQATVVTKTITDVELVGDHFPWVILFTEKDTIYLEVQTIAELYGVSVISGGGEPSNACTENTIRAIVRSETFQAGKPEALTLLSLTDYDPWGYTIANAQFTQILEAARGISSAELGSLQNVNHKRLGLYPDDLTPEERAANAYEPKESGLEEWFAETGGVDGQPLGLELDALPLSRLRAMFAEGIEEYIDLEKRRDDLRAAFVDLLACEVLTPDFEAQREALNEATRNNGTWDSIVNTPIPEDLFRRAARGGLNAINPLDISLFDCAEEVRDLMKQELEA